MITADNFIDSLNALPKVGWIGAKAGLNRGKANREFNLGSKGKNKTSVAASV